MESPCSNGIDKESQSHSVSSNLKRECRKQSEIRGIIPTIQRESVADDWTYFVGMFANQPEIPFAI